MKDFIDFVKGFDVPAIIAIIIVGWLVNGSFSDKIEAFSKEVRTEFKDVRTEIKDLDRRLNDIDKRLYRIEGSSSFCNNNAKSRLPLKEEEVN